MNFAWKLNSKNLVENNLSKIESLVLFLCNEIQNQGYHIYMDRFYSSCFLFNHLRKRGIRATGTILYNRKGLRLPVLNNDETK